MTVRQKYKSMIDGFRVMNFCFGSSSKSCFEFDGETSTAIVLTAKHDHARGGLGVYKKQLFAIGGGVMNADTFNNKLEFLGRTSWEIYEDFPKSRLKRLSLNDF